MEAYRKFQKLLADAENDWEYMALENARREKESKFCAVLESLSAPDRDIIREYFGILQEQELRLLELGCFQ